MNLANARAVLRRVYLLFDPETDQAYLNEDRATAQEWADSGKLALEYGLITRLRGVNDKQVPANEASH